MSHLFNGQIQLLGALELDMKLRKNKNKKNSWALALIQQK